MNRLPGEASSPSPNDGPEKRIGAVIQGKWTVDALLGVGGMASVYAATHRNGTTSALKILHADFAREKAICDRFLREAYVANKVNHPACVGVVDDDMTEDGEPFLVMELLRGETLRDLWVRTGRRMPVRQVLEVIEPVLDCLHACHAIGVIHRDLKPANIFITNQGQTKVLDFGVAQMRDATAERTAAGTALGTPHYMSPEQAMGLVDQLDGRADLFSVGAMLHALVTGQRINNGRTENEALILAATTPVASVARIAADLPVEVIALIDKSLAWDRRNRYANAREMQQAVRSIIGLPAPAVPAVGAPPMSAPFAVPPALADSVDAGAPSRKLASLAPAADARRASVAPPGQAGADDDPRVATLRDLLRQVDRLLPGVRQFGWEHPATVRTLRTVFESFVDALAKDPAVLDLAVEPYSFSCRGHAVWEPAPPFDNIPYNVFACGMRQLRIKPGITMDELRDLLALLMVDPVRELPPEDDIAAALWERALSHVDYAVVDAFAEGDASEREAFYSEADEIEAQAADAARRKMSVLEAKAMAISTDVGALGKAQGPSPMALDDAVRAALGSQLDLPRERWSERYVDAVVAGYVHAMAAGDAEAMLASLRLSVADLVVAGRVEVAVNLHRAVVDRLASRPDGTGLLGPLTQALFGPDTLRLVIDEAERKPESFVAFTPVLETLPGDAVGMVLGGLRGRTTPEVRAAVCAFVERTLAGREADVAAAMPQVDPALARELLTTLAKVGTPGARRAIAALSAAADVELRVEARVLSEASPEALVSELSGLCDDVQPGVRIAALSAIERHAIKGAWPTLARIVRSPGFHDLLLDEKRLLAHAMLTIASDRSETILVELVRKGGVFASGGREASRTAVADVLGELSSSPEVATALDEVAQSRWGTTEETRAAAARAAKLITARPSRVAGAP